ncbi:MAG: hypothetical protein AB8G05_10465 [Oligoflexales bacterium]
MEKSDTPGTVSGNDQLPLSLWLKGDEPYFKEFSLDAEEVMQQLGIKRSRLRQISGNELRVGRKRVERYIRPFYRPNDVENYLSWTRATASHQKSSQMLNTAAEKLSEQSKSLLDHLSCTEQNLTKMLEQKGQDSKSSLKSLADSQSHLINLTKQYGGNLLSLSRIQQEFFSKTLLPLVKQIQSGWQETETKLDRLASINDAFLESIGLIQSNHQVLIQLQLELSETKSWQQILERRIEGLSSELKNQRKIPLPRINQPKRKLIPSKKPESPLQTRRPLLRRNKRRNIKKMF